MPQQVEQKVVDPEAELANAQRMFKELAPKCSVEKRAGGEPQLAPQEKQLGILAHELKETLLCINLARKGLHGLRDRMTKKDMSRSIHKYEHLDLEVRNERNQLVELDCLNYLASKQIQDFYKILPTEVDELGLIEAAAARLRRMENRVDMATKRFCLVNNDNKSMRDQIQLLLVDRNCFNVHWNRTVNKLVKGKEFLMDIFEIATLVFGERDEWIRKLEALKWKGLFQLNRDIAEMQSYEGEINQLAKLEEFLRVKGSRRICEADEIEEIKRQEEIQKCELVIAKYDELLNEIFTYAETSSVSNISEQFQARDIQNFQCFALLCEILEESTFLRREVNNLTQRIFDQHDINEAREEKQSRRLAGMRLALEQQRARVQEKRDLYSAADNTITRVLKGIDELVRLAKCNTTPLLSLLGNHRETNKWNIQKFLRILESEVKSLIEVCYGAVKPPAPTPTGKKAAKVAAESLTDVKLVADPYVVMLRPNSLQKLIPYHPCAYCVEDYIMNLIFEDLAEPADRAYLETIFHLEAINTKFGIYTLTNTAKRHPYRQIKGE